MTIWRDLSLFAPVWVVAVAAAVVLLLAVSGGRKRPSPESGGHLAFVSLAALATSLWLLLQHSGTQKLFSGAVAMDGLGVCFGATAVTGAMIGIVLAASYLTEHDLAHGEYYALVLLATCGALILAMAGDLVTLFIGIETMSLSIYVLAGYRRASLRSQEAALKYFIYGAFASAFVLFGVALIYGEVGRITGVPAVSFEGIADAFAQARGSALGWCGVTMAFGGLGFKVAAVPFHMWAPDVYEGAPTPSTGFMAVAVKAGAFAGLCRLVGATMLASTADVAETFVQALEVFAVLTMVVGNLLAIRQTQIKRMLAYSSIAHAGYVLVGVAAFVSRPEDSQALESVAYYLFGYTAMTLGAFGVALAFERRDDRRSDLSIERLAGAAHRYPALGLAMAVFMFALAGIPPTAGFFGKLSLFVAALSAGRVGVVVVAVLASAIGAYYYLRVLVVMYMRDKPIEESRVTSTWLSAGLWVCVGLTLVVGILPETYLGFARRALSGWIGAN